MQGLRLLHSMVLLRPAALMAGHDNGHEQGAHSLPPL